ncbi:MAG TPA: hypothetical protein EYP36_11080 [Calditrichaeota bacterium]|nr:hypothetical protein [Calditrichota bacterium]
MDTVGKNIKPSASGNLNLIFFAFIVGTIAGTIGSLFRLTLSHIDIIRDSIYSNVGNGGLLSWILPPLYGIIGNPAV